MCCFHFIVYLVLDDEMQSLLFGENEKPFIILKQAIIYLPFHQIYLNVFTYRVAIWIPEAIHFYSKQITYDRNDKAVAN